MSLVNRIRFGSSLDRKLWEKFEQLSKETRIDKSKLLDEAGEPMSLEKATELDWDVADLKEFWHRLVKISG